MKKRMIAVIMAAMMTMSLAACGSKDSGGSTPGTEPTVEDGDSKEETSVPDGQIADEADGSESDSAEESDAQDSQPAEEESSEATNTQNLPDNYDWASVDWERIVTPYVISDEGYTEWGNIYVHSLITLASQIQPSEMAVSDAVDQSYAFMGLTYDDLDEEAKLLLEKLLELTNEERKSIYLMARVPDNYDWASVDWGRIISTTQDGGQSSAGLLISIALQAASGRRDGGEETTSEAVVNSGSYEIFGITSYDDLDEESRTILEKLDELEGPEIGAIDMYRFM